MAIRLGGLISGMDTDSIVKQLMDAQRLKYKKTTDKQTLLTWKQERWKDLNTKLFKLYSEDVNKMKSQTSYLTKKVTSSNENVATVTGNTNAPDGSHTLIVEKLASSQYVTSGVISKDGSGNTITPSLSTTLKSLGMVSSDPNGKDTVISITNGDKKRELIVTDKTTLGDFINACKEAGLNANYDSTQKRIFISTKNSGLDSNFTITTGEIAQDITATLAEIKSLVNFGGLTSADQSKFNEALIALDGKTEDEIKELNTKAIAGAKGADAAEQAAIDAMTAIRHYAIAKDAKDKAIVQTKEDIKSDILEAQRTSPSDSENELMEKAIKAELKSRITAEIKAGKLKVPDGKDKDTFIEEEVTSRFSTLLDTDKEVFFADMVEKKLKTTTYQTKQQSHYNQNYADLKDGEYTDLVNKVGKYTESSAIDPAGTNNLAKLGLGEITSDVSQNGSTPSDTAAEMTVVAAADAEIILDGVKLTGSSNEFAVNGMTLSLKGTSQVKSSDSNGIPKEYETTTFTVSNNSQDIYDMVKNFVKNYNAVLKEMNTLYNAESSRGYDPLSDDDREAMTDDQVEKWETKIKDSILRRDSTLGSVSSAMRLALQTSVEIGGKKYSLASFGIQTSPVYTENGLLHIYGDKEDATYSDKEDKLMKAIQEDPELVMQVLSGISNNLYKTMADKMSAIPNLRSALTFYNDKEMNKIQTQYKEQIAKNEKKLQELENKYYKQFSAMETAMAKLQKQQNALAGLLGNSN